MPASGAAADSVFKSGQPVRSTGVYNVVHYPSHRMTHPIILKDGETFPKCAKCEHTVFLLILAALHFSEDADLQ
jgi:hypothetical protein